MDDRTLDYPDLFKIYALPFVAVLLGLAVSFGLYWQLSVLDEKRINEQFSQLAQEQSKHLQWNLTNYRNALHSTVDLFNSTEGVELGDFRRIAQLIQKRYPEVLALEWLPKVSGTERDEFVENFRRQYNLDYRITELDPAGNLIPAKNRETYFPVTYVQPFESARHNRKFLGFDHFSQSNRRRAIIKSRNQGSITITPSTHFPRLGSNNRVLRSPNNNLGVILYKPVFETPHTDDSAEDQHEISIGVIALSLKIQSVMEPVFETGDFAHNVAIFEHATNPNNPSSRLIYSNRTPERVQKIADNESKITFSERFPVLDRSWSVMLWPTDEYMNRRSSWAPLLALGFGLLFTGILARGSYWLSSEFLGRRKEFHSVIDSAKDAIISTNADGSIRLWNSAAEEIFGYTEKEVMGNHLTDILVEEQREELRDELIDYRETDARDLTGDVIEFEGLRADGSNFPLELTLSKWEQQSATYFTVIVRDITKRKEQERRLEELTRNLEQKVEQRTEELEQFVYAASHDLREPARVMQTYAGFLEDDLGSELDTDVRKDLQFIRDSAQQMNNLIDSLLKLSRISQDDIELETVDVNSCVDQAIEQQEELIESSDVTITREDLPEVEADPALLTDLYQNLLSNAIKHGGDTITLTAERRGEEWVLGVEDDGPGIDPEYQDKIFEPFKHLQQPQSQEGTGIGLSICRRIVDRHDGEIWLESTLGEGAHFRFTLAQAETD